MYVCTDVGGLKIWRPPVNTSPSLCQKSSNPSSTYVCTVDGETFAGLNIRCFSAIKVFAEVFLCYLGLKQCISTYYLV